MVKFLSKCENQVLTMKPNRVQIYDGIAMSVPGKHIRFYRGEFQTVNEDEIEFIRNHRLYNVTITEVDDSKQEKTGKR